MDVRIEAEAAVHRNVDKLLHWVKLPYRKPYMVSFHLT